MFSCGIKKRGNNIVKSKVLFVPVLLKLFPKNLVFILRKPKHKSSSRKRTYTLKIFLKWISHQLNEKKVKTLLVRCHHTWACPTGKNCIYLSLCSLFSSCVVFFFTFTLEIKLTKKHFDNRWKLMCTSKDDD